MNVTILSESPADEAAAHELLVATLGAPVSLLPPARLRAGGWGSVPGVVTVELRRLYYHTDADALVIWADSDDSPTHSSHGGVAESNCRFCQLAITIANAQQHLTQRVGRAPIKTAVALAVPAAEAWYRCGIDVHATEQRFTRLLQEGQRLTELRRQLKRDVYGTETPSLELETTRASAEARRLAADLPRLRQNFQGFDLFVRQVLSW
jgi:hypothetical protein